MFITIALYMLKRVADPSVISCEWSAQCFMRFYTETDSVGAKLRYTGYFASLLHPPGRKSLLLFSVRDMSGGLRNPCFTKFSVVNFL